MIKLINKYKPEPVDRAYYIGRGSGVGNPFSHLPSKHEHIKVKDRDEACDMYQAMFDRAIAKGKVPKLIKQMLEDVKAGKNIGLVCFCAPDKRCHGETIKKYLEEQLNDQ